MLSIARAHHRAASRLILIDEPTKGIAPAIIENMITAFNELKRERTTILLVEQNFRFAAALGDSVAVMDDGRIVHRGTMAGACRRQRAADAPARPLARRASVGSAHRDDDIDPRRRRPAETPRDLLPVLIAPIMALVALPLVGSPTTWVTLTIAALAMGMMIFVIASGLTLVFGLMDVLNFGHGAFIAVGAYLAMTVLGPLSGWMQADCAGAQSRGAGPRHARGDGRHGRCSAGPSSASSSCRSTAST